MSTVVLVSFPSLPEWSRPVMTWFKRGPGTVLLLTSDSLARHTQYTHSASLLSHLPAHKHTHTHPPTHVPCTRIIPWLHSSRIRSIFYPSKIHLPSLFSGGRAVVSQRSISRQCETAAPAKSRPRGDGAHPLLSPDKSTLEAQPSARRPQGPLALLRLPWFRVGVQPIRSAAVGSPDLKQCMEAPPQTAGSPRGSQQCKSLSKS